MGASAPSHTCPLHLTVSGEASPVPGLAAEGVSLRAVSSCKLFKRHHPTLVLKCSSVPCAILSCPWLCWLVVSTVAGSNSTSQLISCSTSRPLPPHSAIKPSLAGLVEVLTTGGIPPAISEACTAERVYKALFQRVILQNERYYARFPDDVAVVQRIVQFLDSQPEGGVRLPSGTLLTPQTFQLLGLSGMGSGGASLRAGVALALCEGWWLC